MIIRMAESGLLPDRLVRGGIRHLLKRRLSQESGRREDQERLFQELSRGPVAIAQDEANEQHYEVDSRFYDQVLGPHLKYSSGYWGDGVTDLAGAEEAMLALTGERAELANGQEILELGCGWGSLTLWMAAHYPGSRITAVSNSASQKAWITERAAERGLDNLRVITADVTVFQPEQRYDRVVSVEMFEHMRNHRELMRRIHDWLNPGGKLFVHIFVHRELTYLFETQGASNWMGRYFFTGGVMPAFDWLPRCAGELALEDRWAVNGRHYGRTLEAWLAKADDHRRPLIRLLEEGYGEGEGAVWLQRWRMFFMACAELFNYGGGDEWFVGHYRFRRD
ncbi:SAM-dependent methyltransferase [Alloalcanivorax profundimaris]|uniref:SAM-dependent methyltransferase n=1 Tax=Alloalcanivorax profundimaris TaxID=2735259 RepID=UPI001889B61C|nr:cyclopropane-fatty-acyl-phospholipid synthase family protein [Alloalcanivorax profundimaris]MBF1803652.1 class I SAM-dependent methyltransferase [Alloalcanivorax profundimaris]MCQ6261423.1 cyclopropane-fatty-acyl-phospholipid synthase family protein [Alcanivorax sp. MM125-6]